MARRSVKDWAMNAQSNLMTDRNRKWLNAIARYRQRVGPVPPLVVEGRLTRMVGLTLEAVGCQAPVGGRCLIRGNDGNCVESEVVGFAGERMFLMPIGDVRGVTPGARVIPTGGVNEVAVGPQLLGRVIDGIGNPLDGLAPIRAETRISLTGRPLRSSLPYWVSRSRSIPCPSSREKTRQP